MARPPKPWYRESRQCWYVNVGGVRHNLGPDEKEAKRRFHELMAKGGKAEPAKQSPSRDAVVSLVELFDRHVLWVEANRKERTAAMATESLRFLLSYLPESVKRGPASSLKPYHVSEWVSSVKEWCGNTKRGHIVRVQRAFNWAVKMGMIPFSPIASVEKPSPRRREDFVGPEQYARIVAHWPDGDPFRDLVEFLWETGCRPAEAVRLRPEQFVAASKRFEVKASESKDKKAVRVIRLTARAFEIVERRLAAIGNRKEALVFENEDGNRWTTSATSDRFKKLRGRTGIKCCLTLLRHGFAQRKLIEGHDHLTVAELMGHANGNMVATVYSHIHSNEEHLRKALEGKPPTV